jgi:predicted nucleic-acid-binding Zn-ribbon protein
MTTSSKTNKGFNGMKKIICYFKGHKRGKTIYEKGYWTVFCKRCGYWFSYSNRGPRLIGTEMKNGFDGE